MKTSNKTLILLIFSLLSLGLQAHNQEKPALNNSAEPLFTYSGIVLDSITNITLPHASISLLDNQSKLIVSGVTDKEGFFSIQSTKAPSSIEVSFMGYKAFVCQLLDQTADIGKIRLIPIENLLSETVVTAQIVDEKADRTSYLVTDKMRERASNAQELLDQIHGVRFDKLTNSIKVGNESSVLLLVDDIQQSATYIENLPPNRISRIEVITAPSGRHLSEGYTAVINFILKKDYSGYDVNVRNSAMTSFAGYNENDWLINDQAGADATYTKDKINIFANYTYARTKRNTPVWKSQTYTNLFEMQPETRGRDNPNSKYDYLMNYVGGGLNYQLHPNHTLSFQLDYGFQKTKDERRKQFYI